ncbi:hypothetical protein PGT21_024323 [Puccinia graminis f. sp. tritici]|uniref:Uncharacterized protein n=1 Tax=Puccinia graminis f. sp. tritici TaxID=56615 RepID=A0A5B0MNL0_PUCGR|nr:hypothetical protein PGT21_024323 [Puccinia graminis f. sp. tritici]
MDLKSWNLSEQLPVPTQIQDTNLWSLQDHDLTPILGHLFDIFTPAPRGDSSDAASWLIFEGRAIATYSHDNITIMCQSSSYHSVLPPRMRSLPHPLLTGDLKLIDHGVKTFSAASATLSREIASTKPGTLVHISGYLLNHKGGIVDVQLEHKINPGSTYGQLFYSTSVAFTDPETQQEKNILVKLCGYGSAITALIENHIYLVSGRFIPRNIKTTPVFHYDSDTVIDLGETAQFSQSMCDKSTVVGLGLVVSKKEVTDNDGASPSKILHVILQHTDYDPVVQFKSLYHVGGRKNLANTFGLFQLGREVLISGNIVGYSEDLFMWIVNAISISVTSGSQSNTTQTAHITQRPELASRRPGFRISIEDQPGPSHSHSEVDNSANIQVRMTEDGDVHATNNQNNSEAALQSDNYYDSIASTSGKKRTKKAILADAKRAKKNLSTATVL